MTGAAPELVALPQGEEELLHLLGVHAVEALAGGEALLQAGGDDREAGPVQGA
jgi:hypothetical protein